MEPRTDAEIAADRAAELVEVVDVTGSVLRVVTRAEMRRLNLWHRCSYVVVVNAQNELLVHQRAHWKGIYPGYWDIAFGGVCGVGEAWEDSAARELHEEAGLANAPLRLLGETKYDEEDGKVLGRAYVAESDEPPTCEDGEVIATDYVPFGQLDAWLDGRQVCNDSRLVLLPLLRAEGLV